EFLQDGPAIHRREILLDVAVANGHPRAGVSRQFDAGGIRPGKNPEAARGQDIESIRPLGNGLARAVPPDKRVVAVRAVKNIRGIYASDKTALTTSHIPTPSGYRRICAAGGVAATAAHGGVVGGGMIREAPADRGRGAAGRIARVSIAIKTAAADKCTRAAGSVGSTAAHGGVVGGGEIMDAPADRGRRTAGSIATGIDAIITASPDKRARATGSVGTTAAGGGIVAAGPVATAAAHSGIVARGFVF